MTLLNYHETLEITFITAFPASEKETVAQKEMFDCGKKVILDSEEYKELKRTEKADTVMLSSKKDALGIYTGPYLLIGIQLSNENLPKFVDDLYRKILNKLQDGTWKCGLETLTYCEFKVKVNEGINPFSKLIDKNTFEKLFKEGNYETKRLEIWQPPSDKTRKAFYLSKEGNELFLRSIRSDTNDSKLSSNTINFYLEQVRVQIDDFLAQFAEEKC